MNVEEIIIGSYKYMELIKILVISCIIIATVLITLKILKRRSFTSGKAIKKSVEQFNSIKNRDNFIIKQNTILAKLESIVQNSPFKISSSSTLQYYLDRNDVKVLGGNRDMSATEFNAIIVTLVFIVSVINIIIGVFVGYTVAIVLTIITIVIASMVPTIVLKSITMTEDLVVEENFFDLYLRLHYILIDGAKDSIVKALKSYAKTIEDKYMLRFVNRAIELFTTHGEEAGATILGEEYKNIEEVHRLCGDITQTLKGSDTKQELENFKQVVIDKREQLITKKCDKIILKAEMSFNILIIPLTQAIIGMMWIFVPDLGVMLKFF